MRDKAVVLLSSGLDSAFNLYKSVREFDVVKVLTFDYGQRAAVREIERAGELCAALKLSHQVIDLHWFDQFTRTALLNTTEKIPTGASVAMDDVESSQQTAKAVWVPNRNGILLNIAAGFAEGLAAQWVITGFNAEEAVTFPDNSPAFIAAISKSLSYSTANGVKVKSFCADMNKSQIVAAALKLDVPLARLWPCYLEGELICGQCESCQRFLRALNANGVTFTELKS